MRRNCCGRLPRSLPPSPPGARPSCPPHPEERGEAARLEGRGGHGGGPWFETLARASRRLAPHHEGRERVHRAERQHRPVRNNVDGPCKQGCSILRIALLRV